MEPLKKAQVEGFLMFAEPEVLFGNLDELCCVRHKQYPFDLDKDCDLQFPLLFR